ncbi:glycerate kinase type-2 family protein (plasmid) [Ensifer adhaerens]|uniref:glycerate kinase type-2 family protein n=1 Tax=Ensifer adhaerens TaxID=106592 RepID=UPI003CEE0B1B
MQNKVLLEKLFAAAVSAADPVIEMAKNLPQPPASGRTVVIGAGKASAQMAAALERIWPGALSGVVVTRYGFGCPTQSIEVLEASHPVPDVAGLRAAQRLAAAISDLSEDDLVIALVSGGGSALLPAPPIGLTLEDEIELNKILLSSGAPISAMNVVRKHLSTIKGGRLAALTKARVVTFLVSDIPGDNPAYIASGPTVPDASTRQDALNVVARYRLDLPGAMIDHLRSPLAEAPKPQAPEFARNEHFVIASSGKSLEAAAEVARTHGYDPYILSDSIEGEARDVALVHAAIAREIATKGRPFSKPAVLLSGGETTVSLRGQGGRGGRNGEFALALGLAIEGYDISALAADTDGTDGSESNAGAFVDGTTAQRLRDVDLDGRSLLDRNDSFPAFLALDDIFHTGPTGTNVNDFRAILII